MKFSWFSGYTLVLALWVGGMALFTFVLTPVIFKSYPRDMAGEIVGRLFPAYFLYNLVLAVVVLLLFFIIANDQSKLPYRLSMICVTTAVLINLFIVFKLHPDAVRIKQQVTSFERESPDSPARKQFRKLHGVSAVLNLILIAEGIALLVAGPLVRK
jgi:uncharacterized membrane protein